jgi:hypothetical protein
MNVLLNIWDAFAFRHAIDFVCCRHGVHGIVSEDGWRVLSKINEMSEKPMIGCTVTVYGQTATVVDVVTVDGQMLVYLDHSIVVPGAEYTRDHVSVNEIQNVR